jgi:beta-glucosidase
MAGGLIPLHWTLAIALCACTAGVPGGRVLADSAAAQPWLEIGRPPEERARLAVAAMTLDEKIGLLHGIMPVELGGPDRRSAPVPPAAIHGSAGYVPGLARLGIPALFETDASLGVANPLLLRRGDVATALPGGLVLSGTFDPDLAYRAGSLVGDEASAKGFNVLLGGGMNLTRDPRNGRNFEYLGEDPLLAGRLAGEEVRGTQDQHVISTVKHFVLNSNEKNRSSIDARIDRAALRESDLLAFEIAVQRGHPGSVMCSYNEINGIHACGDDWLLNEVLKHDWVYPGWVMSDWGAVHSALDARNGLDQESGEQLDSQVWFAEPLKRAVRGGEVSLQRVDDMVRRIVRSLFAIGVIDHPPVTRPIDFAAHAAVALDIARKGIALLKNENGLLPLAPSLKRIAIIGGHANLGVLSGSGSSQVEPANGPGIRIPIGGNGGMAPFRTELYDPSAPLAAVQAAAPGSDVRYDPGEYPADAAALAARSDVAIVFVTQHQLEGFDVPTMRLPSGQDELVDAVTRANPRTVVVLETGNPVLMPWIGAAPAVLAAWYPGQEGGQAIADILFGAVNPSGRLSMTFPKSEADLVRPRLPNLDSEDGAQVVIDYSEAAEVGYRWYAARGVQPLFAFGHGLSYTRFEYSDVRVTGGRVLAIAFDVRNAGPRAGADVPQVYLTSAAGQSRLRLIGFERVELAPGAVRRVTVTADPRLLGSFDEATRQWRIAAGLYRVRVGASAGELTVGGEAALAATRMSDSGFLEHFAKRGP